MKQKEECPHVTGINEVNSRGEQCEECGSRMNLRLCISCGHVGCCESQHGHNSKHAKASNHPIIRSLPLSAGSFTWCYLCNDYLR